jgi:hypothetical protein
MDFVRISAWSRLVRNSMAPAGLTLDFASGQQRSRGVAIALTLSGFLILGLAIDRSDTHKQQIAALESELTRWGINPEADRQRQERLAASGEEIEERVRRANRIIRQLSTPWEDVFLAIESSRSEDVTMLSLESDPNAAEVRASGEARNAVSMINYLDHLRKDGRLSPAVLLSHQVMVEDPNRPFRFTFSASWTSAKQSQK